MSLEVEATFEKGMFRPAQELSLAEGQRVTLTVQPASSAAQRFCGSLRWTRDPEELHRYLTDPEESSWSCRDV